MARPLDQEAMRPVVRLIASYRLLSSGYILLAIQTGLTDQARLFDAASYSVCALVYTLAAAVTLALLLAWPRHLNIQYLVHLTLDLVLLGLLYYYSGGAANDHAILAITAAAFSLAVLPALQAFGVVATCIVILLVAETLLALTTDWGASLFSVGIDSLVATGIFAMLFWLSLRLRRAERRGESARLNYKQLAQVNWDIINSMSTGCIIVDRQGIIRHLNPSACALFDTDIDNSLGQTLVDFSPPLGHLYDQERQEGFYDARPVRLAGLGSYLVPHFFHLEDGARTVVLLDNLHDEIANIQQSRLAAFGKMIHALMHEITNPLATIEQALRSARGQRASGKGAAGPGAPPDQLMPVLRRQIKRIADVVASTRNLLPNRPIEPENVRPLELIQGVIDDLALEWRERGEAAPMRCEVDESSLRGLVVRFDPTHLAQVITNLARNSIDHSQVDPSRLVINIQGRRRGDFAELEYWDNGVGIDAEQSQSIWRAFHSSEQVRAGLGLHICSELCQLNGAVLEYISLAVPARFRLSLPLAP